MRTTFGRVTVMAVTLLIIGGSLAVVIPGGAVAAPQSTQVSPDLIGGDDFSEVENGLEVWERAVLPLRAPAEDAETSIPVENSAGHELRLKTQSGDGPANRDFVGIYDGSQTINIEFRQTQFADTSQFGGEEVQVIVAEFADNNEAASDVGGLDAIGDVVNPALEGDFVELQNQAEQRGITFSIRDAGTLDSDGGTSFELDREASGPYAVMLAIPQDGNSNGFTTEQRTNGGTTLDILTLNNNDQATIIGVETLLLHESSSSVTAPNTVAAGEELTVGYDTGLGPGTTQSVLVYNQETFFNEQTDVSIDGELGTSLSSDDITIEHSIADVNGVGDMTQDGNVFGTTASQRVISGTTPLGDIVDQLSNEAGLEVNTARTGTTVIDASGITDPNADQSGDLTLQTYENWTTGQYRILHVAEDGTVGGVESSTDTITVVEDQTSTVSNGNAGVTFSAGSAKGVQLRGLPAGVNNVNVRQSSNPTGGAPPAPAENSPAVYLDISPDTPVGPGNPVTVEVNIEQSELNGLQNPVLLHYVDANNDGIRDTWRELSTTINGNQLSAQADGLSPFAVGESSITSRDDGDDSDSGGGGGGSFGPSVTASTSISDASPGTPGTTVEFSNGVLDAITFSQEDVEGRVEVDDYGTNLPSGSPSTGDRPVLAGVDITVPDSVADEPATLRMTIDQTELLRAGVDADEIAVLRETGGGYQMLDTTEVDSSGDETRASNYSLTAPAVRSLRQQTSRINGIRYTVTAETRVEARWFAAQDHIRYQYGSASVDPSTFAVEADIVDAPPND